MRTLVDLIKPFQDVSELPMEEQKRVMLVNEGVPESEVEYFIRNLFVMGVVRGYPDIHIGAKGENSRPEVVVNVKRKGGFWNYRYQGKYGKHFQTKLFALCGVPQGGTTPATLGARFQMDLPNEYALKHGLKDPDNKGFYGVDFRVAYTKTFDGWAFVSRILDQQRAQDLDGLGLTYSLVREIKRIVAMPSGLVVVSGPTGSGKTTLLNAILRYLNNGQRAIHTLEDPVEYRLWGNGPIKQINVGNDITFESGLKTALRCAPMIILLGEIRDAKTLDVALWAANTGHLVLTTKHENNAAETITGMIDMLGDKHRGAQRLSEVLRMVVATRLVDTQNSTVVERATSHGEKAWLVDNGLPSYDSIKEPVWEAGKEASGRVPVAEGIVIDHLIRREIREPVVDVDKIYRLASDQLQYESLASGGFRAIEQKSTTLEQCMTKLETLSAARDYPGFRIKKAKELNLSLGHVSTAIDNYLYALDHGSKDAPALAKLAMEYGLDERLLQMKTAQGEITLDHFLQIEQRLKERL